MILRRLTKLSTLGFGRYREQKVGTILLLYPNYLIWVYFNSSHIDFNDEIKTELLITDDIALPKPGTNKDFVIYKHMYKVNEAKFGILSEKRRMGIGSHKRKVRKIKQLSRETDSRAIHSKAYNQAGQLKRLS